MSSTSYRGPERRLHRIHKRRWQALTLWVLVFTCVTVWTIYKVRSDETHTRTALCTFRADLVSRVQQGQAFLVTHPHGFAGITVAEIRNGLINQQRTIDSLKGLNCR